MPRLKCLGQLDTEGKYDNLFINTKTQEAAA